MNAKPILLAVMLLLSGSGITYAYMQFTKPIQTYGVVALGNAYYDLTSDPEGLDPVTTLNFSHGIASVYTAKIYIVNKGKPMNATIAWDNPSWFPSSPDDLTLSWDLGPMVIPTGVIAEVNISFKVNRTLNPEGVMSQEYQFRVIVSGNVI